MEEWLAWSSGIKLSDLQHATQICTKFSIHNLMIKYKNNDIFYYPSKAANTVKQTMKLNWIVNEEIVQKFKKFHKYSSFDGPIIDKLFIHCRPNGDDHLSDDHDDFNFCILLSSFPVDVKRLTGTAWVKVTGDQVLNVFTYSMDIKVTDDHYAIDCNGNVFKTSVLNKRLEFDVKVMIEELYDFGDNKIPKKKWGDHNVIINSIKDTTNYCAIL